MMRSHRNSKWDIAIASNLLFPLSTWNKSHLQVYLEIFVEVPGGHEDEVLLGEAQAGEDVGDLGAEVALVAGRAHVARPGS